MSCRVQDGNFIFLFAINILNSQHLKSLKTALF